MNTNLQKSWRISLGLIPPPYDPRRIEQKIIDDINYINNQHGVFYDKFLSDPYFKKVRRGMTILLKNGTDNGEEIYRILKDRNFAIDKCSGKVITPSTFAKYLRFVRKNTGITKLSKKDGVLKLKNKGLSYEKIAQELNTNIKYVKEVIGDKEKGR